MTLKEWESRLQLGVKLRRSFRHRAPNADERVTVQRVQTYAVAYDDDGGTGSIRLNSIGMDPLPQQKRNSLH